MVFDIRISPDGDLLFLCFAKEKVGKRKATLLFLISFVSYNLLNGNFLNSPQAAQTDENFLQIQF
ncbi:TPA: hypothetical protein ACPOHF_001446, partial [Haemophilus influenzae]